ncbi:hypothetical protein HOP50_10g61100 [Chloropicon primus]|nr:hypothetical protein HOP50_10g61100 [Chloropicon primus]
MSGKPMKPFPPWVAADETMRLNGEDSDEYEHQAIQEIVLDEREELLKECQLMSPYWRGFKSSEISLLADKIDLLKLGEGEYLARNREQACFFGVYLKGHAEVTNERKQKIGQLSAGDILGEFTFFGGGFRGADIVTRSRENIVAIFPFQDFISLYMNMPKIASKIIYVLNWTGFSRIVQGANKKNPKEDIKVSKKQQPKEERKQILANAIEKSVFFERDHISLSGSAALDVILPYCLFERYTLPGHEVFKEKQKSNIVLMTVAGSMDEGGREIPVGNFLGESSLLQDNIEWSFRRQEARNKSMGHIIGLRVSDIHELISTHVQIGLTLYVNIARSWLLKYKKEGTQKSDLSDEEMYTKGYFFDIGHIVPTEGKVEKMIEAVLESQATEREKAARLEREKIRKKRQVGRRTSLMVADLSPYKKDDEKKDDEDQGEEQSVMILKDLDFNADMLHSCLCYSRYLLGFKQRQIDVLSSVMTFVKVRSGETITQAGEFASYVGFIVSGGAEGQSPEGKILRELAVGDVIGEFELFLGGTRSETILSASDNTVVAYMTFKQLLEIATRHAKLCIKLLNSLLNAAVSRSRHESYSLTDPPKSNISQKDKAKVLDYHKLEGLGKLFKPFVDEKRFQSYLERATMLRIPKRSAGMADLLLLPNSVYVSEGTVEIKIAGVDKVQGITQSFIPDFRLLKSDSIYHIQGAEAVTPCTLILFEHKLIKEMRRDYPLLSIAFQLHLSKLNLGSAGYKVESSGAVTKSMRVGEKAMTKTEKLRMESIMAKKKEQYKEELKKAQMKKRLKKKNARILKKKQTLGTAVKDAAKLKETEKQLANLRAQNELFRYLDNIQFHSKCFRQFTTEEIKTIGSVMSMVPYKTGETIIKKGDESSFVVFMLAGKASINIKNDKGKTVSKIDLMVGDILGEMALFEGGVRSADVVSASDSTVVGLLEFTGVVMCHSRHPKIGLKLISCFVQSAVTKLRSFYLKQNSKPEVYPKEHKLECTEEHINESGIFSSLLTPEEVGVLCKQMFLVKYKAGEKIIVQGTLSTMICIVVSGTVLTGSSNSAARIEHNKGYFLGADIIRPETLVRYYSGYSEEECTIAVMEYDKFMKLNKEVPKLAFKLLARMAQEIVWIENNILRQKIHEEEENESDMEGANRFKDWTQTDANAVNETLLNVIAEDPDRYEYKDPIENLLKDCQKNSRHFHGFEEAEIQYLAKKLKVVVLQLDECIVKGGDDACFVCLILRGTARVLDKGEKIGELESGDVLGELSLFDQFSRGADVLVDSSTCMVAIFNFQDLREIHEENPMLGLKVLRIFTNAACNKLRRRCLNNLKPESPNISPCSNDRLYLLLHRCHKKNKGLGDEMDMSSVQYLAERMCLLEFESGDLILRRGQRASYIFFILEGVTGVRINGNIVARRVAGNFIGETAFFQGFKEDGSERDYSERTADVVAEGKVLIAAVSYRQLKELNERHPLVALLLFSRIGELQVQLLRGQTTVKSEGSDSDSDSDLEEEEVLEKEEEAPSAKAKTPAPPGKRRSSSKAPALGEIREEEEEDEGEGVMLEERAEKIKTLRSKMKERKVAEMAMKWHTITKESNSLVTPANGISGGDIDEVVSRRIDAVIARRQSIRDQARRQSMMSRSSIVSIQPEAQQEKENGVGGKKLVFAASELSEMVMRCKSLLDLDMTEFADPSKEEVLTIFEEVMPKMGMIEEERKDIIVTTFKYESKIRKLETENVLLKEEMDVKETDLSNIYTQPHVLDFFEKRLERLQKSLGDKVRDWQEEKERADTLSELLNNTRSELRGREETVKNLKEELQRLNEAFGSMTKKEGPRAERVPRHIETLRRSRSQSPSKRQLFSPSKGDLNGGRSANDFHPSLSQRLLLSRQRAATAQLTPVTKNKSYGNLNDRPSTQYSVQYSADLLDVRSSPHLSFDKL